MVLTRKKNATPALAQAEEPVDKRMESIIMQMPIPRDPQIIVFTRPIRSNHRAGTKDPMRNMIWILPRVSTATNLPLRNLPAANSQRHLMLHAHILLQDIGCVVYNHVDPTHLVDEVHAPG